MIYQLRRTLILAGLLAGPVFFVAGSLSLGRLPQGVEWVETVFIVPLISLGAGGAMTGLFVAIELVQRSLWPAPHPDDGASPDM